MAICYREGSLVQLLEANRQKYVYIVVQAGRILTAPKWKSLLTNINKG
jgi:hypothetical protein